MFEGALVESRGQLGSPMVRWTAAGSVMVQCVAAAVLVAIPMLRPESLGGMLRVPELVAPTPPKRVVPVRVNQMAASSAMSLPATPERVESAAGRIRRMLPGPMGMDAPVGPISMTGMGAGPGIGAAATVGVGTGSGVVRASSAGQVRVSSGVSSGMLLGAIRPVYPAIAKAAGVSGAVVVEAVISKSGTVERLRAVSGPEMLRGAAIEAIEGARYRPYELNGQPVAVETTITVNFRLGG